MKKYMEKTPLYIRSEDKDGSILYVVKAVQDFGEQVLDRDFQPAGWPECLPLSERFVRKDGQMDSDSYRVALWDLYNRTGNIPIFSAEVVKSKKLIPICPPPRGYAHATSIQHFDMKTRELITPNKTGVIVSRAGFDPEYDEAHRNAMAYFLGFHEMGHLALGNKPCDSSECVFSHNYDSFPKILEHIVTKKELPVCGLDRKRLREFKERWSIK